MPLLVVGTWSTPEDRRQMDSRGCVPGTGQTCLAARSPEGVFIRVDNGSARRHHTPLGKTTVEELTSRIIEEVKRGLPEALVQGKATYRFSSGMGATSSRRCGERSRGFAIWS